ncbi:MAG: CBS domain-containing protein [Gammaproteobacteria bacterium]|nr:CBS domain-containing protein [Gammaproteobacteria bacterium]
MITIDEFMSSKPYTLRETNTLNDAVRIMTEKHIRHIPVTDNDNHVIGLVTQRDVLAATEPRLQRQVNSSSRPGNEEMLLADMMIRDVSVIQKSDSLRRAALYIQSHKYGCLPVISDDCLVGIITDSDFIDIAINLLEQVEIIEEDVGLEIDNEKIMDDEVLAVVRKKL